MRNIPQALAALTASVAIASAAGCGSKADADTSIAQAGTRKSNSSITVSSEQRERIGVFVVAPTTFHQVVRTTGTVVYDGDRSTQILAPISGPVTSILVQPGARVRRGQALAYVSSPDFAEAVADYRKARATAQNAERVAKLDEQLFRNDAIARRDLDQAQTDAVSAAADRDAAFQRLQALGVDDSTLATLAAGKPASVTRGVIRSPIAGTLVERQITPGQLLEAGSTPCFTVADISAMWVMANVFEADLSSVGTGDEAIVTTDASDEPFSGKVDNIAAFVDPSTKATSVRILVPNRAHLLKKDMYVNVAIRSRDQRSGILIPVAAVLRDEDNQPFVYVEAPTHGYERRTVTLGSRIDERYAITNGLQPGDHVVSEGGLFLQFAQSQ
jgi:cobalt-zinc-cadmium efflux system membrane fusion protein